MFSFTLGAQRKSAWLWLGVVREDFLQELILLEGLKFHVLPWPLWASQGPKSLAIEFLCSCHISPHLAGKPPHPATSSISRTGCNLSCPQLNGSSLNASLWNASNRQVTSPSGKHRVPYPLVPTRSASHTPSDFFCPQVHLPCGPAGHSVPSSLGCEDMWLITLASLI